MIKIISVGKIKEDYLKKAIDEYKKRLSRFTKLEIVELKDLPLKDNMSEKEEELVKIEEGRAILNKLSTSEYIISLDRLGTEISSIELSKKIESIYNNGTNNITFIIGGSLGLSDEVLSKSNFIMSFSKLTFPHMLFRVMLLEQIYRAYKIMKGETYNK
ncbi:MAG: 23S rRNA (pseudouridine(1915)-N(3))-methyltransferase RlmH [Gammaproteobacteria bacterium]|nr:23S rRNA (pseudouridine(1915)-N(3))-methyltransferase RlmH [Gammaproteobacteria bacterium]